MKLVKYSILLIGIALMAMLIAPVSAVDFGTNLNLVQKDPSDWDEIASPTASGVFNYGCDGFSFHASGTGLTDGNYVLISYAEPYPGNGSKVLGTGIASGHSITITGSAGWASNLTINHYGADAAGDYKNTDGAKVWLVPVADFDGTKFTVWNPTTYLFDQNLISPLCSVAGGASTTVSGSISKSLAISTDKASIEFGAFKVGDNEKDLVGTISVTSSFVPAWKVTAATSDGQGYMRIESPFVTGTKLTENLKQYNYNAAVPGWVNANGLTYTGTGDNGMSMSFLQNVKITDVAGAYGTVVTYTVAEV